MTATLLGVIAYGALVMTAVLFMMGKGGRD